MNHTELLSAISDMLDQKLDEKLDVRFEAFEKKLDAKLDAKLEAKFEEKLAPIHQRLDRVEELATTTHKVLTENVLPRLGRVEELTRTILPRLDRVEAHSHATRLILENDIRPRLDRVEKHSHATRLILENDIQPRLQNIEACYTETAKRYLDRTNQIDALQSDVDVLKTVVRQHSGALQRACLLPC